MTVKLTDKEIIKGLKKVLELMLIDGNVQRVSTVGHAIDLINRLQADKEALINGQKTLQQYIARQDEEVARLKKENKILSRYEDFIKAEAYKEFAEKGKSKLNDVARVDFEGIPYFLIGTAFFNNLLKETEGGS